MASFVFQLEGVLRHRLHVEEQRQRELAAAQREMTRLETELRAVGDAGRAGGAALRAGRLVGRLDVRYLAAHGRHALALRAKAAELTRRASEQQAVVDQARLALAEAAGQRKVMEKLKERRLARWREDRARRETALLDEAGSQLAADPGGEGPHGSQDDGEGRGPYAAGAGGER